MSLREDFETILLTRNPKHFDIRTAVLDLIRRVANQIRRHAKKDIPSR